MSPTMPSRPLGFVKKGIDADMAGPAGTGAGAGSSTASGASGTGSAADMRTGALVTTLENEEGVTKALAHEAHAVIAPTVERTFISAAGWVSFGLLSIEVVQELCAGI